MRAEKVILSVIVALAIISTVLVIVLRQQPLSTAETSEVKQQVVEKSPVRRTTFNAKPSTHSNAQKIVPKMTIQEKLDSIIISQIVFVNISAQTAFELLANTSQTLDPEKMGVPIEIEEISEEELAKHKVTLDLQNVSLTIALKYLTEVSGLRYYVEPEAIIITPKIDLNTLVTKVYQIGSPQNQTLTSKHFKSTLEGYGIQFFPGTVIQYELGTLTITHVPAVMSQIDQIMPTSNGEMFHHQIDLPSSSLTNNPAERAREELRRKLNSIIIKQIEFHDTPILSAIKHLVGESRIMDPKKIGVLIVPNFTDEGDDPKITMKMQDVTLLTVIKYVTIITGLQYRVEPEAIVITSAPKPVTLRGIMRTFQLNQKTSPEALLANPKWFFDECVMFPSGTGFIYDATQGNLTVIHSQETLDRIQWILRQHKVRLLLEADPLRANIVKKLNSILIKNIEFQDTPIADAIHQLIEESQKSDPEGQGVNIIMNFDTSKINPEESQIPIDRKTESSVAGPRRVGLTMRDIPLITVIKYLTTVTGLKYRIEPEGVYIEEQTETKTNSSSNAEQ